MKKRTQWMENEGAVKGFWAWNYFGLCHDQTTDWFSVSKEAPAVRLVCSDKEDAGYSYEVMSVGPSSIVLNTKNGHERVAVLRMIAGWVEDNSEAGRKYLSLEVRSI